MSSWSFFFFFFNDTATTEIYTLSLHDALPIWIIDLRPVATRAEIGYVLARRYWGRGLMTEAARAVVEWTLAEREIYRVWAVVDLENPASQRVLEKVGMTREGVLRRWVVMPRQGPTPRDVWCFARVREREATR